MTWTKNWFSNMEVLYFPLVYQGITFRTVEHFYQAMKLVKEDVAGREKIARCKTPYQAKRMGKTIQIRPDWKSIRLNVMEYALRHKFKPHKLNYWYQRLMETGDEEIIEWNNWHDNYWGSCTCSSCTTRNSLPQGRRGGQHWKNGYNHLGKLLMKIRKEMQDDPCLKHGVLRG